MNKKAVIGLLVAGVIIAAGVYVRQNFNSKNPADKVSGTNVLNPDNSRAADVAKSDQVGAPGGRMKNANFTAANGVIAEKKEKSITLTLDNGGSAIVFYSETTFISKIGTMPASDLAAGQAVVVSGSKSDDGVITAATVQVRESLPESPEGGPETVVADKAKDSRKATAGGSQSQPDSGRGFANGEIVSINGDDITIKLPDASQISIVLADDAKITKIEPVSANDLAQGIQVMAMGTKASDGSIAAQMIQIGGADSGNVPVPEGAPAQMPGNQIPAQSR